jgi:hypothetical protein
LSNIAAGTSTQIQSLFDQSSECGLVAKVIAAALNGPHEVRKEAAWVLCNIVELGSDYQLQLLLDMTQAMDAFVDLLKPTTDTTVLALVLKSIQLIFQTSKRLGLEYTEMFDDCGGLEPLEALQEHANDEIYTSVVSIIEEFFNCGEEEPDQNLVPAEMETAYTFGLPKNLFPTSPVTYSFGASTVNH